jgi:Co/Zn/Cd efflux system component
MTGCDCEVEIQDRAQSRVLILLLLINGVMFVTELGIGWWAQSTALIADAMDMLADALVYSVGLYAVGRALTVKAHAARISGWLQVGLGLLVLVDILRRFLVGSAPVSGFMMGMGLIALLANVTCLILIARHRAGEVHMRASWIFSKNDAIANLGVILAGGLVAWTGSRYPDLVIGVLVALVVLRGGMHILSDARTTLLQVKSTG